MLRQLPAARGTDPAPSSSLRLQGWTGPSPPPSSPLTCFRWRRAISRWPRPRRRAAGIRAWRRCRRARTSSHCQSRCGSTSATRCGPTRGRPRLTLTSDMASRSSGEAPWVCPATRRVLAPQMLGYMPHAPPTFTSTTHHTCCVCSSGIQFSLLITASHHTSDTTQTRYQLPVTQPRTSKLNRFPLYFLCGLSCLWGRGVRDVRCVVCCAFVRSSDSVTT